MISKQTLIQLFEYKDGILYWKVSNSNRIKIGQKAGAIAKDKRERINVCGKLLLTHRIIFAMHHDYWPKYVDHIDCDKSNNKIENLREITVPQNQWNRHIDCRNTSGIKGVYWDKHKNKWVAAVRKNNKNVYLGRFKTKEEAAEVVKIKRIELHQQFARHI